MIQLEIELSEEMLDTEEAIQRGINPAGLLTTEYAFSQYDTDDSPIKVEGKKYNVRINCTFDDGKPRQLTHTVYGSEAAKDLERKLTQEVKSNGEKPTRKATIQQLFDKYIIDKKHEVREYTAEKNKRNFALYIKPTLADVRIDKITVTMLR